MKTIAFFNNKGGVGKTSLVYHLAWMYADLGYKVIAADFDPQANLTSMFLDDDRLEELWPDGEHPQTVLGAIKPILGGTGDINRSYVENIADNIGLIVGDLGLSTFEDDLSAQWPACLDGKERAFRVISAFWRLILQGAEEQGSDLALIDVGPNLGAINRAALIAAEFVIVPLAPDLFSLQGLRNLGPTLRRWRKEWKQRYDQNPEPALSLPSPEGMQPKGYVIQQYAIRLDRPVQAYERWMARIPLVYRHSVLASETEEAPDVANDPYCLAQVKHYRSLMPLAMEARKPMFFLKPADGAIGAHTSAVQDCYRNFKELALKILQTIEAAAI
ncbi:MAG: AAA family ATPase [Firmicutes bacterium]|nr:AAA family ATPase [Bacillota bacterium]